MAEIHSFLLIGQSNMAGRGFIHEVEPILNKRIRVLKNGRWGDMFPPINFDRSWAGINLAESFADAYAADHEGVDVGLIPCADGGTSLEQWQVGGLLYDHAVLQARLAQRTSIIHGILWHQGETDCPENLYPHYLEKCRPILTSMREDLGIPDVPLLIGGLGDFLQNCTKYLGSALKNYHYINAQLVQLSGELDAAAFVTAEGLTANPDNLHFNAKSLREFGLRYYREYRRLEPHYKKHCPHAPIYQEVRGELEAL